MQEPLLPVDNKAEKAVGDNDPAQAAAGTPDDSALARVPELMSLASEANRDHWKVWLGEKWVAWLEQEAVRESDKEEAAGKRITHFFSAGPVVLEIWLATPAQWFFAAIFPFFVAHLSTCPSDQQPFAHYPSWVLLIFLPVVGWSMYCEMRALMWVLPTLAAYCAPFKFFGKKVSFNVWFCLMFMLSLATHGDLATNGLFLAKILRTVKCSGARTEEIAEVWRVTIKGASCVSWIPNFDHLDTLLLIGWGLMFVQPFFCLLYALPLPFQNMNYGVKSMGGGYKTLWSKIFFKPDKNGKQVLWHADVIQWLATVNRMVSITDRNLAWSLERAKEELAKAFRSVRELDAESRPEEQEALRKTRDASYSRSLTIVTAEFERITVRLALVSLLEKAYMLEVQVTIFAISRFLMPLSLHFRFDGQMLISLMFSFVVFAKGLQDAWCQINDVIQFEKKVPKGIECIKDAERRLHNTKIMFWVILSLVAVALGHCMLKFAMAFVCEDSMWDLHVPFWHKEGVNQMGCVDLGRIMREFTHFNASMRP